MIKIKYINKCQKSVKALAYCPLKDQITSTKLPVHSTKLQTVEVQLFHVVQAQDKDCQIDRGGS